MSNYGNQSSSFARQGSVSCVATVWRPLVSSGSLPLTGRSWIKIFVKGRLGHSLALEYVNVKNADGTFTAPTGDTRLTTIYPGMSYIVEPLADTVNVYGRLVLKVGATGASVRVIVSEFR